MVALTKRHTLFEWSAQAKVDPIPVARAKGIYFWTPEGKRYIDFNSQLMCVNIGHGDERVVARHQRAGGDRCLTPTRSWRPKPRARLGAKLAEIAPGDIDVFFFTNGGSEANENAIKVARLATGPAQDPRALPLVPRRDGRQHDADRRSPPLGERAGHLRASCTCSIRTTASSAAGIRRRDSLAMLEEVIQLEGPADHRRLHPRNRSPAPTASWCRPTATCRASAISARVTAS